MALTKVVSNKFKIYSVKTYLRDSPRLDEAGRLSQNYKELEDSVQDRVQAIWDQVQTETIDELTDYVLTTKSS